MLISKIYNSANEEVKDGLFGGLIWGLIGGLIWGLIGGLIWGLIGGLIWGLIWGLVVGLVVGLFGGLVVILINWSEALPFLTQIYPIILLIIGIIILTEILFWLMPKEKLSKGKSLFWHTCKRKVENIFEVLMGFSAIAQIYILIREVKINITPEIWQGILRWIGYIGVGIICLVVLVGLFYLWIKLNSLKYQNKHFAYKKQ